MWLAVLQAAETAARRRHVCHDAALDPGRLDPALGIQARLPGAWVALWGGLDLLK
jgi:hypothetical protein